MKTKLLFFVFFALNQLSAQNNLENLSYIQIDSLANIALRNEDNNGAVALLKKGLSKAKAELGSKDSLYAYALHKLGYQYLEMGEYALAEPILIESKTVYQQVFGNSHPKYARVLITLGQLYLKEGIFGLAEPLFIESKKIYEKEFGKEDDMYLFCLANLAGLYFYSQKLEQAEALAIETKDISAKKYGKQHRDYATSIANLATLYIDRKKYAAAEALLIESKNILLKTTGKDDFDYADRLNNLSMLYMRTQKYEKAEPLLLEIKDILSRKLGNENVRYAEGLNNLAILYLYMNKEELSLDYLRQSISVFSGLNMSLNFEKAWADSLVQADYRSHEHFDKMIQALGVVYDLQEIKLSDKRRAIQVIVSDLAMSLIKKHRDKYSNEQDKLRMLSQSNDWMLKSLRVIDLEKQASKAFEIAELNKAGLLLEASKSEQAYQFGALPEALIAEEKSLFKKYAELEARLLERGAEDEKKELRTELNETNLKINSFKQKIEKEYPKYAQLKYKEAAIKTTEIQALLEPKTALLEYVIGDSSIYVFYLDKQKLRVTETLIASEELKKRIFKFHEALSNYAQLSKDNTQAYKNYTEAAHWFYQKLLEVALKEAKGIEHLIIIGDGELAHLPFESFLTAKAKPDGDYSNLPYLIKDYKISYNYSATLWKENKEAKRNKNNGQLFAVAANYESKADSVRSVRSSTLRNLRNILQALPAARKEVEALQNAYKGYFAFDSLASEKGFKAKAGDYAIIHLAMHGLLDAKNPILSSLAFTEDGDSVENNFLQAYEISKMELNADLVVLSACETGFGKFEKGNGTASLARAFMYAGVPAMVVSLWQVNDASTSAIMQLFYKNLSKGMDKAEALRQAKLDYIKTVGGRDAINRVSTTTAAHPAYWAAFVIIGDSRPIAIATKGGGMMWYIVGGVGLLALVGAVLALRRRK